LLMGADTVVALVLIGVSAVFYHLSMDLTDGGDIFPKLLSVITAGLSIILLIMDIRKAKSGQGATDKSGGPKNYRPYFIFLLAVLYVASVITIGFFTSTVFFMVLIMICLGVKKIANYFIAVACVFSFYYFLFDKFLHVPLPRGLLF